MAEGRHVLDVLFRHAGEGVTVQDQFGSVIYANEQAAALFGFPSAAELIAAGQAGLAARLELVDESGNPRSEDLPGQLVLQGAAEASAVVGLRSGGKLRWARIRSSPIKNDHSEIVWALTYLLDITHEVLIETRTQGMIREAMATDLDVGGLMESYLSALVPQIARAAAIHLVDDVATLVRAEPSVEREVSGGAHGTVRLDTTSMPSRVIASASAMFLTGPAARTLGEVGLWTPSDLGIDDDSDVFVGSIPVRSAERTIGAMTVVDTSATTQLAGSDASLLLALAEQAGVSLARAQVWDHEHETAAILLKGLAPVSLPEIPGMQLAVRQAPHSHVRGVSGDFHDAFEISGGRYAIVVGDIEGKGIGAAAEVGMIRQSLRAIATLDADPSTVFRQLNMLLSEEQPPRTCTLAYLIVDPARSRAEVALAGHPPPIHVEVGGSVSQIGRPCPPLGVAEAAHVPQVEYVEMAPGDTLVAYTDGYAVGNEASPETITPLLHQAETEGLDELLDRLMGTLREVQPVPRDDVLLLALRAVSPS